MRKIMTIYEVRRNIHEAMERIEVINYHALDDTMCQGDFDSMRIAYQILSETFVSKWTNQLM